MAGSARRPGASHKRWRRPCGGVVTAIRACGVAGGQVAKGMKKISYKGYRFPPEIIQHAIWLYANSPLDCCAIDRVHGVLRFQDPWLQQHKI